MKKQDIKELYLMMFPEYPDIVTIRQLMKMLGISRHLAYDLVGGGDIPAVKIGTAFKIPKAGIIAYFFKWGGEQ